MEPVREGLLGLVLFISNWLAPTNENALLSAHVAGWHDTGSVVVKCHLELAWNDQMEQIIDAGIPLRFRLASSFDGGDTARIYRILSFDVVKYTYTIVDSGAAGKRVSREYPMVLLALREYCRWEVVVPRNAGRFWAEAAILPSRAAELDRNVDMSRIWGRRKVSCEISPASIAVK